MQRWVPRDRRTPGRADGGLGFTLRWPSGEFRQPGLSCSGLHVLARLFRDRLRMVPADELPEATARLYATVRKAAGGLNRIALASWVGTESVEAFFASARRAWRELPKEDDDQRRLINIEAEPNCSPRRPGGMVQ